VAGSLPHWAAAKATVLARSARQSALDKGLLGFVSRRISSLPGRLVEYCIVLMSVVVLLAFGAQPTYGEPLDGGAIAFERVVGTNSDIYTIAPQGGPVHRLTVSGMADFAPSWSSTGRIAFVSSRSGSFELFTMSRTGAGQRRLTRTVVPPNKNSPDWAPDRKRVAFTAGAARRAEVYVLRLGSSRASNVTRSSWDDSGPTWSPDGRQIVFSSDRNGGRHLYRYLLSSRRTLPLTQGSGSDSDPSWAPDGRRIAFTRRDRSGNYDVYVLDVRSRSERRLTSGRAQDRDPTWSPDSTELAFVTNRDNANDYEIYVMRDDGSNPVDISRSPGTLDLSPDWSSASVHPSLQAFESRALQSALETCDVRGTPGDNNLVGNDSDQVICGKDGDDTIHAGGGNDRVSGGAGKDMIWGQQGADLIQGNNGKDELYGGRGSDTFYPGGGKDTVDGGYGLDRCDFCDASDAVVRVEIVDGG
jgi:TolB protein